jgi:hypothetical protein
MMLAAVMDGTAGMVGVFREPLLGGRRLVPGPRGQWIANFPVARGRNREAVLERCREDVAVTGLYERIGSAATAIHLAWYLGCERVVLAGIDGGGGIARRVERFYGPRAVTQDYYDTGRRWAVQAAERLGMQVSYVQRRAA